MPSFALPGLAGLALVAATVGGLVASSRRADETVVEVQGDTLVVRPLRLMALWALCREVRIPLAAVAAVEVCDRADCPSGFRAPGSNLPGVLKAGSFRRSGQVTMWFAGRASRLLVVRAPGRTPSAVVVQVADPDATATALSARVGARPLA